MGPVTRTECGSCQSPRLLPFLDLGTTPLADSFPRTADAVEQFYPLGLVVCQGCWLVQNIEVVPDELLFNADYGFYTGSSPSLVAYFDEYASWVQERFPEHSKGTVVEIACNDGTLLRHFSGARRAVGIEASPNVAAVAEARGLEIVPYPFDYSSRDDVDEPADLIIANNVLAHVSNLDAVVGGIGRLLAPSGIVIIECQYFPDLLAGNQFDHVYHEHRSFFSLTPLQYALARHGLFIRSVAHTPAQGGSVRVIASRVRGQYFPFDSEQWLRDARGYTSVQGRVMHVKAALSDLMEQAGTVVGYGATAKSTTLLNVLGTDFAREHVSHVVDLTPHKQGRFTPGTKIPIVAPGDRPEPDTYLLLAWNYLSGVLRREREFIDRGGKFIVPIPFPVVL